ncbi:sedoheptulokinase isoform X2 [Heterodontus francisci]|uniref:sedoheptulokinase isoform X2 n=1 Tax=Heterodontus francisci TaxID=7792 RepID=UPI00355B1B72
MSLQAPPPQYVLGLDLGTTSVKAVLLEAESRAVVDSQIQETKAEVSSPEGEKGREQDVARIVSALHRCVAALPRERLCKVGRIGVSGQMHGVMLWKSQEGCVWQRAEACYTFQPGETSHLITWQDGRCSREFLDSLAQPDSHLSLATGYGCATIFWPQFLEPYNVAGTIHDYVVAVLCGLKRPLMSAQNAASWGYFNTRCGTWNLQILRDSGFPTCLLPVIVESGAIAGKTVHEWYGVPVGTEVGVALGDLQCSVYSCMTEKTDAVLNVSTSAQLTFALAPTFLPPARPNPAASVAYYPYLDGIHLAVAASLNGGNVLSSFIGMLQQWTQELGLEVPESTIYSRSIHAALNIACTDLAVQATIFGERHSPDQLASVTNISPSNLSLGHVTRALCCGIVENLHSMLPCERLIESGVQRIMGSGSALTRNEVLKQEVEKVFTLPIVYRKTVDSAVGVAMVMLDRK